MSLAPPMSIRGLVAHLAAISQATDKNLETLYRDAWQEILRDYRRR